MGWIVAIFVVIALAWAVVIGYELVRPGKLNWNQPSWLIPRRRTGPRPPGDRGGRRLPDDRSGAQPPRDQDHPTAR